MTKTRPTFYKNLAPAQEDELVLWLGFLKESIKNALVQKRRWRRNKNGWDLQMFFVAVGCIDEAIRGLGDLGFFSGVEQQFWQTLTTFQAEIKNQKLIDLRHNIHRNRIYNRKNKNARPMPSGPLFIFGGYNESKDEYTFLTNTVKLGDAFKSVTDLRKNVRSILKTKLFKFYKSRNGKYNKGMIPWTYLRSFECFKV